MSKRSQQFLNGILCLALLGTLVFASAGHASASVTYHVKPTGSDAHSGTTWGSAFRTLAKALSVAVSGDQIWVAAGTYKPRARTNLSDPRSATFTLISGVAIYGGFAGTESSLIQRHLKSHPTILSGNLGVATTSSDNAYHVVTASGVDNTALLDGFIITQGNANGTNPNNLGGGMYTVLGSPTLRNLTFKGNSADFGGGMQNDSSSPTMSLETFSSNTATTDGAGMYNNSSSPSLTDVTFNANSTAGTAGGMSNVLGSNPALTGVTFSGNAANFVGGIYDYASSPTLTNVTLSGNISASSGGGMGNQNSSSPTLQNVTFSGNTAAIVGGGMYNDGGSNPSIENTILWGDNTEVYDNSATPTVGDSIVAGGCPSGATCAPSTVYNLDPHLGLLRNNGGFTTTMALGLGSAAIDSGNGCAAQDQRGVGRAQGLGCDIGAYEVKVTTFHSQAGYDGQVLESGQATNHGGSLDSAGNAILVGDDASNRRYRGFLSFNTAPLADGAALVAAKLQVFQQSLVGDPFGTQGTLNLELANPYFGSGPGLAASDWQAGATIPSAGSFSSTPVLGWYYGSLTGAAVPHINKTGTTQFRLHFKSAAYNSSDDYLSFYSGNFIIAADQPQLLVYHNP